MWLVDGLGGGRFAIVTKSHHCLVDGVAGMDVTTVLFDAEADPPPAGEPDPWVAAPEPSESEILARALLERAIQPAEALRGARALLRRPRKAASAVVDGLESIGALARAGIAAPSSPFNVEISPYRRFAWVRADLAEVKRIKDTVGGTVNDVVIASVAGALGRFLRARGHATAGLELKAMVPISVRLADQHGDLGNKVSAMYASLPVGIEDPAERLRAVSAAMGDLKESKQAVGASILTDLADFAPTTILGQAGRMQSRQRFFNMVVTNVPGPQIPIYLLGRELEDMFPVGFLPPDQGLFVAIMSYNGAVNFGLLADYDSMDDVQLIADGIEGSLADLSAAADDVRRDAKAQAEAAVEV